MGGGRRWQCQVHCGGYERCHRHCPTSVGVGGGGAKGAYTSENRERDVNVCVFMRAHERFERSLLRICQPYSHTELPFPCHGSLCLSFILVRTLLRAAFTAPPARRGPTVIHIHTPGPRAF